jgi:hypothetical protein
MKYPIIHENRIQTRIGQGFKLYRKKNVAFKLFCNRSAPSFFLATAAEERKKAIYAA